MNSRWRERFAFLRPYLARRQVPILAGWIFVLVSTALDQISPWMIKVILDSLQAGKPMASLYLPLGAILAATVVGGALLYFQRLWVIQSSRRIEYELRRDLFAGLMVQPKRFFDKHSIGDIMSKATNDLDRIRDMVGPVVLHLARMGCLLVYTTICIGMLNVRLMWLGLLPSLMMPLLANIFLKKMYGLFGGIQKNLSALNSFVQDTISGIQVVKAYGKQEEFQAKFQHASLELRNSSFQVSYFNSIIWPAIGALGAVGLVLVAWLGGKMVVREEITLGTLSAAIIYLLRLQFPLVGLGWVASMIQRANVSIDRLAELRKSFLTEPDEVPTGRVRAETPSEPLRQLEARKLTFTYDGGRAALEGISLTLRAGTSLGIVGPTGAGKTTLMHVLCGIYPPPPGTLFLDGKGREEFTDEDWIRHFAYAPQDGFLFSTSIRANILMGKNAEGNRAGADGAPRSPAEAERAAEWSALARDLNQFPQGYESMLGEKGINLSGGQRQRVGLARALLADAPVLGLDDTLSALDTETESVVLDNLRRHFAGRTLIIISHRYSAVRACDNIVYLAEGRILEQGTHAELLRLGGAYAAVWERQKLSSALELD